MDSSAAGNWERRTSLGQTTTAIRDSPRCVKLGVTPETVVGYLAWQSELLDSFRAISPRELLHDWQLAGKPLPMPRESLVFPEADAVDFFLRLQARIHG